MFVLGCVARPYYGNVVRLGCLFLVLRGAACGLHVTVRPMSPVHTRCKAHFVALLWVQAHFVAFMRAGSKLVVSGMPCKEHVAWCGLMPVAVCFGGVAWPCVLPWCWQLWDPALHHTCKPTRYPSHYGSWQPIQRAGKGSSHLVLLLRNSAGHVGRSVAATRLHA